MAKPFNSQGEVMAVTVRLVEGKPPREMLATVCHSIELPEKVALLEFSNGDVIKVDWKDILFHRSLTPDEITGVIDRPRVELTDEDTKLSELEEGKWYFIKSLFDHSDEYTGVKKDGDKLFIQYLGGDFDEPYVFWYEYTHQGLNEGWQHAVEEDYPEPIYEAHTLYWAVEVSNAFYNLLNDLSRKPAYCGKVTV